MASGTYATTPMHIDSIQLFRVPLPAPPGDNPTRAAESVLVGMSSDGHVGWGEVCLDSGPYDNPEWSAGAFACLRDWLAPAVARRTIHSGEDLQSELRRFAGNQRAKSALDVAWWNLEATRRKLPLYRLLGGNAGGALVGPCLGVMDSMDQFLAQIGSAVEAGYAVVTLKFRPGWDVNMLRAVRQTFASEPIAIDCDGLCTLAQQEMFYRLEDFHLLHIEQPLADDDLVGHAMLQSALRTPIGLDQSVTTLQRVEQAIDLASCRRIRIDVARVGGLTPALAIQAACAAGGIACSLAAPRGVLAACVSMALATLPNFSVPAEYGGFDAVPWAIVGAAPRVVKNAEGQQEFLLPEVSGPGVSFDLETLARAAVEQATIR